MPYSKNTQFTEEDFYEFLHDIQKAALIDERYLKPKKLKTLLASRACR